MSLAPDIAPGLRAQWISRLGAAIAARPFYLCMAILAIAPIIQLRWGTVPDTSWIITMCERVYNGDRLYIDFIEVNPPFTLWLYMPAYVLAVWTRLAPELVVQIFAYAVCCAGLWFAAHVARRARFAENAGMLALLPAFLALLVILPGNAFTEREHLGVALVAPLLALTAWRVSATDAERLPYAIAIFAGLAGSVIVLVKPYYAIVILAPALYLAWKKRSLRSLLSIEYWVIGAICVAYLGAVIWIYPEFMRVILPMVSEAYLPIGVPLYFTVARYGIGYLLVLMLMRWLMPSRALSPLANVVLLASLAAAIVLTYQGKGWPYHAYPMIALGLAALLCHLAQSLSVPGGMRLTGRQKMLATVVVLTNVVPFFGTQKPDSSLAEAIRAAADRPTIALIGSDLAAGHPLARMVDGQWVSAYCSDWLGAFALYLEAVAQMRGDENAAERYEKITTDYVHIKLAELKRVEPQVLLLQKNDSSWRERLAREDDYAAILQNYRQIAEDAEMIAYLRNSPPTGSPAAASD